MEPLIEQSAKKLLQMFGAGEHKPGSGSAAALQGLLSAQLIRTVINLTVDPKRRDEYAQYIDGMEIIDVEIENRIYPRLLELFQEDSIEFDKAIQLRIRRDKETNLQERSKLSKEAVQALVPATEIPIEIIKLCMELAEYGAKVFDDGFRSARGDSGVAMSGAVSAIAGCISIVELNLLSFGSNEWVDEISSQIANLKRKYLTLTAEVEKRLDRLNSEVKRNVDFNKRINAFRNKGFESKNISEAEIEKIAYELHQTMWKYRDIIWKKSTPIGLREIIIPGKVIKLIGYRLEKKATLGNFEHRGKTIEIAGTIDNKRKKIDISEQFSPEVQNFTAAHELGHAIFHKQETLHRDRSLDGSEVRKREEIEWQADKFATYFLMPKDQLRKVFEALFQSERFLITDETAFALGAGTANNLRAQCVDKRGLSRKIASTVSFNQKRFESISKQFGVSDEAMAIRLEELGLIEF